MVDKKEPAFLDESVRLVMLQFSFSNPNVVPECIKGILQESIEERIERKAISNGQMFIDCVQNVSLVSFLNDLNKIGYEMVEALYKPRPDRNGRRYYIVRFIFAHPKHIDVCDDFLHVRDLATKSLMTMCQDAAWRVRAYLNPFFQDQEAINGQYAMSFNLEARKPLFHPNGESVKVWQKDKLGERIGNAPIPIKPNYNLSIISNKVYLKSR